MTVSFISEGNSHITCHWFSLNKLQEQIFRAEELVKVENGK